MIQILKMKKRKMKKIKIIKIKVVVVEVIVKIVIVVIVVVKVIMRIKKLIIHILFQRIISMKRMIMVIRDDIVKV